MTVAQRETAIVSALDPETAVLVRLSAVITGGSEAELRLAIAAAVPVLRPVWADELLLQSYLFAGFPRMLNAAREWRKVSRGPALADDEGVHDEMITEWHVRGERTCEAVYGAGGCPAGGTPSAHSRATPSRPSPEEGSLSMKSASDRNWPEG